MPLVPLQSNSGPNTSLFAPAGSGGGGGGGGPNPVVSTITFPSTNGANAGTVLYTEELAFGNGGFQPTHQIRHSAAAFPTDANVIDIISPDGIAVASLASCNGLGLNFQVFNNNTSAKLPISFGNTALTNISSINGATPGGSAGPNPVFSTVTCVAANITTAVNITNDTGIANDAGIVWPTQAGTTTVLGIGLNGIGGGGQYGNSVMTAWTDNNYAGNPGSSEFATQRLYLTNDVANDNQGYIERCSTTNNITLVGPSGIDLLGPVGISSLNVSSINGAAPSGGGGPPPAVVSTISSLVNVSTINSGSPGVLTVSGSVVVTDYLGASQISTPSIVSIVPGGAVSVQNLTTSSITSAAPIINMTAPVSVSSLSVSSINGTSYPPAGAALQFSTLFSGNSTINCDPLVTTALINFNTTVGHVYQIQTQMMIQGNGGQDGTENDDVVQDVVNQVFLNTTQGSFISTTNSAARDVNIGTCGMWKATQATQALGIQGTFSTQVNLKSVVLLDYGAI